MRHFYENSARHRVGWASSPTCAGTESRAAALRFVLPLLVVLTLLSGCGETPSDMPAPVENLGSLEVRSSILLEPGLYFRPDSMTVLLDGVDHGFRSNPTLFEGVYAGTRRVQSVLTYHGLDFTSPVMRVEALFDQTVTVNVDTKVGMIQASCPMERIPGQPEYPDSLRIVLDGDTLTDFFPNPATLSLIVEGDHTLVTFASEEGQEFQSDPQTVSVGWGRSSEVALPLSSGGVMIVSADYNSSPVGDFGLRLDGVDYGNAAGPRAIANIPSGLHRLTAYALDNTTRIEGWARDIAIARSETTYVDVELIPVSPFEGSHAPSFDGQDVDGNKYCLADHFGQVVFMYWFSNT